MPTSKKGTSHKAQLTSLKRIEGQVRGIIKMVESERYCIDILTQFRAIHSSLNSVEIKILEGHIKGCIKDAFSKKSKTHEAQELLDEVMHVIKRMKKVL